MAEKFIAFPYMGTTTPNRDFLINNGVSSVSGYKVGFAGSNNNVSNPVAVCCKVGNSGCVLCVGSGFFVCSAGWNAGSGNFLHSQNISNATNNVNYSYIDNEYLISGDYLSFNSLGDAISDFVSAFDIEGYRNIKYNGTGCILIGDSFLPVGSTAHAYVTPNLGGSISESGITVKRAGADVPFTYANGIITFTVT